MYTPISTSEDHVEEIYEDCTIARQAIGSYNSIIIGDFNTKLDKKWIYLRISGSLAFATETCSKSSLSIAAARD